MPIQPLVKDLLPLKILILSSVWLDFITPVAEAFTKANHTKLA
jgi:hypothetical protein